MGRHTHHGGSDLRCLSLHLAGMQPRPNRRYAELSPTRFKNFWQE